MKHILTAGALIIGLMLGNLIHVLATNSKVDEYKYESLARYCEEVRFKYLQTKNEHYFDILVHLLPNSYKVVKL